MECKVDGRTRSNPPGTQPLDYGLENLTPGQKKFAFADAADYLSRVMMDPKAPWQLKEIIRTQNAVGLMFLQQLLAGYMLQQVPDNA